MAYGLKYFFEFEDQHGQREYRVEILEDGFTGNAAEVVDASDRPVELEYKGKEDVFQNPVVPSVCHVRIIAKQQSEFRDLVSNDQFKHIMKLKAKINGTFELIWAGIHMPDIYKEVFGSTPYELELKFTDGLGQLKNIEYKPIGNTDVGTSFQSTADILAQALGELPSEIDTSIFEYIDIREDATNLKLLDNTRPNSVLNQHYLNEQAFFKDQRTEDASGNLTRDQEFIDCYEVIQRVCKTFQAKIFKGGLDLSGPPRSNPVYRIVTVNLHNSAANFFGIDPTQTGNSSQALEIRNEENLAASAINANFKTEAVLEGSEAELEFYLAVSQVLLEYKGQPKKNNIIEEGNFQYRDTRPGGTSAPSGFSRQIDWNEQTSSTVHGWSASIPGLQLNTGTLKSDTYSTDASKLRFHVKAKLSFDVSNVPGASGVDNLPGFIAKQIPNQFVISPEIKFTDNNGNDVFLNTPGNLNLSGSVTKLNMIVKQPLYEAEVEGEFVTGFVGANDLVITLDGLNTFSVVDQNRNSYNIEPLVQYEFIKLTNEDTDLDVVSKTNNASVANNANVDDRKLDIPHSDSATGNDASAIGIKDSNGEIIDTENWDKGSSKYPTTLSHLKLLAREYLHNWEDYRRRIKGSLTFGDKMLFNKLLVITEDGTDYGMMFYFHRWDLRHALVDFEAIEGIYDKDKAASLDPATPIYDNPRDDVTRGTFSTNAAVINADSPDINIEDITTDNATVRPNDVPKLIRLDDISASGATVNLPLIFSMIDEIITIHTQTSSGNSLDIKTQSPDVFENGSTTKTFTGSQKIELAFNRSTNEWITL
jgi:hypothetical protein